MGKRICLAILLLALSLEGAGCGDSRQTAKTGTAAKTGTLSTGYFYEEDGIILSSQERFLYSDWEPLEFDYICTNPTCSHLGGSCSARTISGTGNVLRDFSLLYQDRLIILHAYSKLVDNDASEEVMDYSTVYYTDVYEANPDGSGRRKTTTFSGAIATTVITNAAILANGKLYFGGAAEVRNRVEQGALNGGLITVVESSDAVYCLDLNDYTLETFAVTENREGLGYQYQFYEYDGMVYAIVSSFQEDRAIWYRIDPMAGTCEEILRFDSNVARFQGAVGNRVYYYYENAGETLYARELAAGAAEREILTAAEETMGLNVFIFDGKLLVMTDGSMEEHRAEYAVLDPDGKALDTIQYEDYISFLDVVGDKILYYKWGSEWEVWWADKADIKELSEKGTRIGPYFGPQLDTLAK